MSQLPLLPVRIVNNKWNVCQQLTTKCFRRRYCCSMCSVLRIHLGLDALNEPFRRLHVLALDQRDLSWSKQGKRPDGGCATSTECDSAMYSGIGDKICTRIAMGILRRYITFNKREYEDEKWKCQNGGGIIDFCHCPTIMSSLGAYRHCPLPRLKRPSMPNHTRIPSSTSMG